MKTLTRWAATVAAAGAAALTVAVLPAQAATDLSYQTPVHGGLLLNAANWGGTGSKAATLNGTSPNGAGVVNDRIDVWSPSNASVASDFTPHAVTGLTTAQQNACTSGGATGCFLIEYTPGGKPTGLCVSTVTAVQGAYARLRNCALANQSGGANIWQDFAETFGGDQLNQLQAVLEPGQFVLNDKAYGGNGSQVISWPSASGMGSENQLWEHVGAAA